MKKIAILLACILLAATFASCKKIPGLPTGTDSSVQGSDTDRPGTASSGTDTADATDSSGGSDPAPQPCEHESLAVFCSDDGVCKTCGKTVEGAVPHTYVDGKCSVCGTEGGERYQTPIRGYYTEADGVLGALDTGKIDYDFMVNASYFNMLDDQYYQATSEFEGVYKIPEDAFIAGIRKTFDLPDERVAELKAASPYFYDLIEYKDGYFYYTYIPMGFGAPSYLHVPTAYTDAAGVLTLYVDYQSFTLNEESGESSVAHVSYYKMVYEYKGVSDLSIVLSDGEYFVETQNKFLADSLRLTGVSAVDSLPSDANTLPKVF